MNMVAKLTLQTFTYLLIFVSILTSCESSFATTAPRVFSPEIQKIYVKFCAGNFDGFNREIKKMDPADPNFVRGRLLSLLTKDGQLEAYKIAQKNVEDFGTLSEIDRLISAVILMKSASKDFTKIQKLLSFTSQDKILESYRQYYEATFDLLIKKPDDFLKKVIATFDDLPYLDEDLLVLLYRSALWNRSSDVILAPYFKYIDQLPTNSPQKYLLLAFKNLSTINSRGTERHLMDSSEYFKKAYSLCRYDQTSIEWYLFPYLNSKYSGYVEKALLEQINLNNFYSINYDLYLTTIYLNREDFSKAKNYLQKAENNRAYFRNSSKKKLDQLKRQIEEQNDPFVIFVSIIAGALAMAFLIGFLRFIMERRGRAE